MIATTDILPNDLYVDYIKRWFSGFRETVNMLANTRKKLHIIALSRKMPRFLDWLIANEAAIWPEGDISVVDVLSKGKLTTEIAIPFIFNKEKDKDCNVIIVDDSILLGNTMRRAILDVKSYSGGVRPYISAIVSYEMPALPEQDCENPHLPNKIPTKGIVDWLKFVSECNASNSLPLDVEFPILELENKMLSEIEDNILNIVNSINYYKIKNRNNTSVTVLLDEGLVELTDLDFSKARFFYNNDKVRLAVYSPFVINQSDLTSKCLFKDEPKTNNLWNKVLEYIDARESERTFMTLTVIANYIHSLITLKLNPGIFEKIVSKVSINKSDLDLLFGVDLSDEIAEYLIAILESGEGYKYMIHSINLPSLIVPKEFESAYKTMRLLALTRNAPDFNVSSIIRNVFKYSSYNEGLIDLNVDLYHQMHSSIYESFDSLKAIFDVIKKKNIGCEVNKVIDEMIDKGEIIPRYCPVKSEYGIYWRRFFTSAYSSIEL